MDTPQQKIHRKIVELAKQLGRKADKLGFDDEIPASGLLDSPALLELIFWYENEFELEVEQHELNLDNFGTVNAMVAYLERSGK